MSLLIPCSFLPLRLTKGKILKKDGLHLKTFRCSSFKVCLAVLSQNIKFHL